MRSIIKIQLEDGVTFNADGMETQQITEAEYGGLRIKISATVGGDFHRNTSLLDRQYIFEEAFKLDSNKQHQWRAFLNRSSIEIDVSFEEIDSDIEDYMSSLF